jgi:hypothetical protein
MSQLLSWLAAAVNTLEDIGVRIDPNGSIW